MKKQLIIAITSLIVIGVGLYAFLHVSATNQKKSIFIKQQTMEEPKFLADKRAILYASSPTEQLEKETGKSMAIFIDKKGSATAMEMDGMEFGASKYNGEQLYLDAKKSVYLLGKNAQQFPMKRDEIRNTLSGYLSSEAIFFSLYNTGFSENKDYDTGVRYGNTSGFKTASLPFYVATAGTMKNQIIVLTQDLVKGSFDLKSVTLKNKVNIKQLASVPLPHAEELDPISSILEDKENYYFVLSYFENDAKEDILLATINKLTFTLDVKNLAEYRSEEIVSDSLPYNFDNSTHLHNKELYYINGLGEVYSYNTSNDVIQKKFRLNRPNGKFHPEFEQVDFRGQALFYLNNRKKDVYFLEKYDLITGEMIEEQKVENLNKILKSDDKDLTVYNLELLHS
ncbi:hypothetical protein MKZ08_15170 [Viridibacillus sp. FSL R5-0477]|uniref:Uncharacterized protein n=1 Tax=Viridibacillus arenosi FSL R5-213 TaxID=1227360 RepID=W4EMM0_9BACL|nr:MULTISPECIES: hypothetical protein [Viridibacillus]ETT81016.1 hypothetical protein C176_19914 [Viridibacillus arenosi FSL R5-213]OMC83971.1 hypothetical protein BK130_05550 [Viridibacillus sp. FSL H8-0123]OMC88493.1 hypothetical protein BK128_00670 [Viridibacillus sp. FSL H7-0596]OMC93129.1 hypothetical protein BK137_00980 [Viridibacillus arenosi]